MNELNLLLNIQLNQQSGNDNTRENPSLSFDNYLEQMVSSNDDSEILEPQIEVEELDSIQESFLENSDDIQFYFSNIKVNNLSNDVEGKLVSETVYSKLLPMSRIGHGTLSYFTKNYNPQMELVSKSDSQHLNNKNPVITNTDNATKSIIPDSTQTSSRINESQQSIFKNSEITNRVISDLKKSNELNLSKASFIYNNDDYQLKKLTIVNSETVKLIIIRDYTLSSWQKESLAEAIKVHIADIHNNFQTSKIIINGTTYGN